MALTINTDIKSLKAQRSQCSTRSSLSESMQRLSSGLRINSAADDAACLAISVTLDARTNASPQAALKLLQYTEQAYYSRTSGRMLPKRTVTERSPYG